MFRSNFRMLAACLLLATAGGCREAKPQLTTLSLDEVPSELMRIAREQLPDVVFDTAFQKSSGTIEIRGKARNGKIREVDIRPDGTIEEVE